jgi:hypothetical protein
MAVSVAEVIAILVVVQGSVLSQGLPRVGDAKNATQIFMCFFFCYPSFWDA